ncbi:MAG: single-stranded DNA-binding protein [Cyanobacteria bacterium P01_H01_bin.121]
MSINGMINTVSLVGHTGREIDIRYFESGAVVANTSLAVKGVRRDAPTNWFNLEFWGKTAQIAADYVRKGGLIGITGSLKFEHWTDRSTGANRSKPVIRVDRLELLGSRRDNQGGDRSGYNTSSSSQSEDWF